MIDLHLHSSFSDGFDPPRILIDKALSLNIKAIAITDHDNVDGIYELLTYGENKPIIIIPGIEISIKDEPQRELKDVHIVGLNIDYESPLLIKRLNEQLKGRIQQKKEICKRLKGEFGYNITFEEVKEVAGGNSVGRPHIVEIMIKNNPDKVVGKSKNDLFKMISVDGSAYVERPYELNLEDSISLINASGGVPIIAHPGIYEVSNREKFIEMCIRAGIRGVEIEYTYSKNRPYENTEKARWAQNFFPDYYRKQAEKFNLIKSGGSDYHGNKKGIEIGDANVPDEYLKKFI
jgi:predicted metal-dependent phosphoesterase TrpH